MRGVIYFAATSDLKHVKITFTGSSKRAEKRAGDLDVEHKLHRALISGTYSDAPAITLLGCIMAEDVMEKELHVRFADRRLVGDWFRFEDDIRKFVMKVIEDPALLLALDIFANKCTLCDGMRSHKRWCQHYRVPGRAR